MRSPRFTFFRDGLVLLLQDNRHGVKITKRFASEPTAEQINEALRKMVQEMKELNS